ncbi:hypothetical protein Q5752_005149 [Cryptotrichosporon argae]
MSFPADVVPLLAARYNSRRTAAAADAGAGAGARQRAGPVVDVGRPGGARLDRRGGRWQWTWIEQGRAARCNIAGPPLTLYSSLTPQPDAPAPTVASTADYLRDLDVFSPLVAEIAAADLAAPALSPGARIVVVRHAQIRPVKTLVCFVTGELDSLLQIIPILAGPKKRAAVTAHPTVKPAYRAPTPILQLAASEAVSPRPVDCNATPLLVRLHTATLLLNLVPNPAYAPSPLAAPASVALVARLTTAETEGRSHVNVALDPATWSRALIVDEGGAVWVWQEVKERSDAGLVKRTQLRKLRPALAESDGFFRIAFGTRPGTALVLSSTTATILDIDDVSRPPADILSLTGAERFVGLDTTALARAATYTCLVTTREVVWIDETADAPALRWKHDLPLEAGGCEVTPFGAGGVDSVLVSSAAARTLVALHTTQTPPVQLVCAPRLLAAPAGFAWTSLAIYALSSAAPHVLAHYGGGVGALPLALKARARQRTLRVEMDDFARLRGESEASDAPGDAGAETKHREVKMRWVWEEINRPPALDDTLSFRDYHQYIRELDAPLEHPLTALELAREALLPASAPASDARRARASLRPLPLRPAARADFSAELAGLDHAPYFPLTHAHTDTDDAGVGTPLEVQLARVVVHTEPAAARTGTAERPTSPDDLFAAAAGLSLNDDEPPPVRFALLGPRADAHTGRPRARAEAAKAAAAASALQGRSARALLAEWDAGALPGAYVWRGATAADDDEPAHPPLSSQRAPPESQRPIRPIPARTGSPARPLSQPHFGAPPILRRPATPPVPPAHTLSSPTRPPRSPPPLRAALSSQPHPLSSPGAPAVQTQIERGAHGARPVKKKSSKKRMGGF